MIRHITWATSSLLLARLAFGALFLCAACGKILDPDRFVQQVARYDIIGPDASAMVGTLLPWAEFLLGSCLVAGVWLGGSWLATTILFGCFTLARASVLHRGLSVECGCGFTDQPITLRSSLIVAALFITSATCFAGIIRRARSATPGSQASIRGTRQTSRSRTELNTGVSTCV